MLDVTPGPAEVHAAVAHATVRVTAGQKRGPSGEAEMHAAATRIKIAPCRRSGQSAYQDRSIVAGRTVQAWNAWCSCASQVTVCCSFSCQVSIPAKQNAEQNRFAQHS